MVLVWEGLSEKGEREDWDEWKYVDLACEG